MKRRLSILAFLLAVLPLGHSQFVIDSYRFTAGSPPPSAGELILVASDTLVLAGSDTLVLESGNNVLTMADGGSSLNMADVGSSLTLP
jgi:hypothetical protein